MISLWIAIAGLGGVASVVAGTIAAHLIGVDPRAAELLRTGRYNVTEAATEVGYSSLSHFSKAFCETIGCCPVLYPAAKNVILDR